MNLKDIPGLDLDHHDVQLRKFGNLVRMEWDKDDFSETHIPDDELSYHLESELCLADGVTLRDLFALMLRDPDLFEIMASCDCFAELSAELDLEPADHAGLLSLEVAWGAEVDSSEGVPILVESMDFRGRRTSGELVSLDTLSLDHILDLPMVLNESLQVRDKGDPDKVLLSALKKFSVIGVARCVLGELTNLGDPDTRDRVVAEREGSAVVDSFDDGGAKETEKTEGVETLFPCRICGSDRRCGCFGKPHDICHGCFTRIREN